MNPPPSRSTIHAAVPEPPRRPCAFAGCPRSSLVATGDAFYPHCSSGCRTHANELEAEQVHTRAVRAGEVVDHPARGGGTIRRPCEVESLLVQQGDVRIFVPVTAIERALARLGRGRPAKAQNGHGHG